LAAARRALLPRNWSAPSLSRRPPALRLLAADPDLAAQPLRGVEAWLEAGEASVHVLFPAEAELPHWLGAGYLSREGVQFHWRSRGEADFEALLMTLTRDKRKRIRQERKRVREAGVRFRIETGHSASRADWALLAACYARTYAEHRSLPYLNEDFFLRWAAACPDAPLLFIAELDGQAMAASLCARQADALYGRYWAPCSTSPGLHFEACYYQPLERGIANGIRRFEGGARGPAQAGPRAGAGAHALAASHRRPALRTRRR
jgi:predicted N-acyltransferase